MVNLPSTSISKRSRARNLHRMERERPKGLRASICQRYTRARSHHGFESRGSGRRLRHPSRYRASLSPGHSGRWSNHTVSGRGKLQALTEPTSPSVAPPPPPSAPEPAPLPAVPASPTDPTPETIAPPPPPPAPTFDPFESEGQPSPPVAPPPPPPVPEPAPLPEVPAPPPPPTDPAPENLCSTAASSRAYLRSV